MTNLVPNRERTFRPSPGRALLRLATWISFVWVSPVAIDLVVQAIERMSGSWEHADIFGSGLLGLWVVGHILLLAWGFRHTTVRVTTVGIQVWTGRWWTGHRSMAFVDVSRIREGTGLGYTWASFEDHRGERIVVRVGLHDASLRDVVSWARQARTAALVEEASPREAGWSTIADRVALASDRSSEGSTSWRFRVPPVHFVARGLTGLGLIYGTAVVMAGLSSGAGLAWFAALLTVLGAISRRTNLRVEARRIEVWRGSPGRRRRRAMTYDAMRHVSFRRGMLQAVASFEDAEGRSLVVRVGRVDARALELAILEIGERRSRYLTHADRLDPASKEALQRLTTGGLDQSPPVTPTRRQGARRALE
ncbi:MAG: hypothetical protein AAF602_09165 [Myxococcota bacterium]